MGELHALTRGAWAGSANGPLPLPAAFVAVVLVAIMAGCDATVVRPPTAAATSETPTSGVPASAPTTVDAGEDRIVWLVDAAGAPGVWTTDLAGGDVRTYVSGVAEEGGTIHEAFLVGDSIVFIRDGIAASDLWTVRAGSPPLLLHHAVESFLVAGEREVVVARDVGADRQIIRVPLDGSRTTPLGELPLPPPDGATDGPFGLAISPDGRTVAAGWVGGRVRIMRPGGTELDDVGAPLVVGDDGRLVATTGRAGEAYLLREGELAELAPPDSDPRVALGSGIVAWGSVADDGSLRGVEVRDVLSGAARLYPANGAATNVVEVTAGHVRLEATAFDPLRRTVAFLGLEGGRFGTFEASAPAGQP